MGFRRLTDEDIAKLVVQPSCDGVACPEGHKPERCCSSCGSMFAVGELRTRFDANEKEVIANAWSSDRGYWDENGCRLPRTLRPIECLRYSCVKL